MTTALTSDWVSSFRTVGQLLLFGFLLTAPLSLRSHTALTSVVLAQTCTTPSTCRRTILEQKK